MDENEVDKKQITTTNKFIVVDSNFVAGCWLLSVSLGLCYGRDMPNSTFISQPFNVLFIFYFHILYL